MSGFLALEISVFSAQIHFLNLVVFLPLRLFCTGSFSSQFSTYILLPLYLGFSFLTSVEGTGPTVEVVFSMKMSRVVSLLNPRMNYWQKLANPKMTCISGTDWGLW